MNLDKVKIQSIIDMFLNCKIRHQYIIFVKKYSNIKEVINYLKSYICGISNVRIKACCNGAFLTNLDSGAVIKVILASDQSRGHRSFLSLYEDACPQEIINYVISPISLMQLSFNMDRLLESEE